MSVRTNAGFLDALPIGVIMEYGGSTAPDNWMLCQGQAISRTTYSRLFAVIGTAFGSGDGTTTFNVPDFREATSIGKSSNTGFDTLGDVIGSNTTTLTQNNLPTYVDNVTATTVNQAGLTYNGTVVTGVTISKKDSSTPQAISNIQKSIIINKIIKVN